MATTTQLLWRKNAAPLPPPPPPFEVGQLAHFPRVPREDLSSVINDQHHVNDGAAGHPVLIIGSKANGKIVTCLQITSLGGRALDEKHHDYSDCSRSIKASYLAIDHDNTTSHTGHEVLKLVNNRKMDAQSYANLDFFLTIEAAHLDQFHRAHGLKLMQHLHPKNIGSD